MRKDFDMLLRNTYFMPWSRLGPAFDQNATIAFCKENNFSHFMLDETKWCKSAGWYESVMPGGYSELKQFVTKLHDADIIFTLHGRVSEINSNDPLFVQPRLDGLVNAKNRVFVDAFSELQQQISARFVAIADLINADGLYLDWSGAYSDLIDDPIRKREAVVAEQSSVINQLTRPMILQASQSSPELHEHWCLSGQLDHYPNVITSGKIKSTRDQWNDTYFLNAQRALKLSYPAQIGWLDFGHGITYEGKPIEDQNPASLTKLCKYAREHNLPIVLEATLEEINSHPQKDELLTIIKTV